MKADRGCGIALLFLTAVILVACSSTPTSTPATQPPPAPVKKEPILYTGKSCMSQMAGLAARWQPDALPVHMESSVNAESNGQGGKATVWRGMFASASRVTNRTFTCSGSRLKDEPAVGVTSSAESASGPMIATAMFQPFMLATDSDKAYEVALQHGGDALIKKDAQQPVIYTLDWDSKKKELVWGVVFGTSVANSKGVGIINANTGQFLRAGK